MATLGRATIVLKQTDGVIFDMDGVVTRTATVHAAAWKKLFDEYLQERADRGEGPFQPFDAEVEYRLYVDGKPRYDGVLSFLSSRGIDIPYGAPSDPPEKETVCGLGNKKEMYFRQRLEEGGVKVYESTVELVHRLKEAGVKTGIFSASRNVEVVLRAAGVIDLFDARFDGVDAAQLGARGKPHPDTLLELARRLMVRPASTVVIEDAIAGVQAGRAGAFMKVIGVNRSGVAGALMQNGADVEVTDLKEVVLE
jgi:alpha,alpha-trehalase